ncbi:DEAD/DEAH box helicase [Chitinilyticum piscinae]|uniref:DEAD/DEAH box helicase n=1 Tax=Chitinilyticum piscinae TaxID=2866724 RepID=A0A8J7FK72_9NEIS|nr:DEAD/DEAH box helicase [Chitinilyticum piscinae]MBE9609467.1 DEAD/DEAH box helicase [Chitinilyticum piscinae]
MTHPLADNAFVALGLDPVLAKMLADQEITTPTPVQEQTIPALLEGNDVLASAQTGTGKTAAFLLPALQKLMAPAKTHARGPRVLILTPTRELAEQVSKVAISFCRPIPRCKVVCVVGGVPYPVQNRQISQPYEVLVATPGRLQDLMSSGRIDFRRLETFILDEADRMLDMGFIEEVEAIASALPADRQTALFSATVSPSVEEFAAPILRDPLRITVAPAEREPIAQALHYADGYDHKLKLAASFLKSHSEQQAVMFTATKADADQVADWLKLEGIRAAAMHGDLPQSARRRTLDRVRRGEVDVLVATDVAARGIDVASIDLVINFDLPRAAEDYIHRIGRTGRAGRSGQAISLISRNDAVPLIRIRNAYKIDFEELTVEGLEANFRPRDRKQGGGRGGRPQGNGGGRRFEGGRNEGRSFDGERRAPRRDGNNFDSGKRFGGNKREEGNRFAPSRDFDASHRFDGTRSEDQHGEARREREPRHHETRGFNDSHGRKPQGFGGDRPARQGQGEARYGAPRGEGKRFDGPRDGAPRRESAPQDGKRFDSRGGDNRFDRSRSSDDRPRREGGFSQRTDSRPAGNREGGERRPSFGQKPRAPRFG